MLVRGRAFGPALAMCRPCVAHGSPTATRCALSLSFRRLSGGEHGWVPGPGAEPRPDAGAEPLWVGGRARQSDVVQLTPDGRDRLAPLGGPGSSRHPTGLPESPAGPRGRSPLGRGLGMKSPREGRAGGNAARQGGPPSTAAPRGFLASLTRAATADPRPCIATRTKRVTQARRPHERDSANRVAVGDPWATGRWSRGRRCREPSRRARRRARTRPRRDAPPRAARPARRPR